MKYTKWLPVVVLVLALGIIAFVFLTSDQNKLDFSNVPLPIPRVRVLIEAEYEFPASPAQPSDLLNTWGCRANESDTEMTHAVPHNGFVPDDSGTVDVICNVAASRWDRCDGNGSYPASLVQLDNVDDVMEVVLGCPGP